MLFDGHSSFSFCVLVMILRISGFLAQGLLVALQLHVVAMESVLLDSVAAIMFFYTQIKYSHI